jgi:excinuclease ABC subunit A
VIVVEHDEEAIRSADYVVDIGPGAGVHGGFIVAEGTPADDHRQPGLADRRLPRRPPAHRLPENRRKPDPQAQLLQIAAPAATTSRNVSSTSRSACSPASPASPVRASRR